jgi:tripartite-type tricarboxylate transporter receptor subunit TctC
MLDWRRSTSRATARREDRGHSELRVTLVSTPRITLLSLFLPLLTVFSGAWTSHVSAAEAEAPYPNKPLRFIVPFPPGAIPDRVARLLGERLHKSWGQPVVVVNRPGAGGVLAAETAAKSPPDGYTLFLGGPATHAVNVTLYGSKLTYDPVADFAPVSLVARIPMLLLAPASLPVNNVQELVAMAKARPGALNYTSAGISSSGHIAGGVFRSVTGIDIVHVPSNGPVAALQELVAGRAQVLFDTAALAMPQVRAGKLKALAVTGRERMSIAPEIPTMIEAGVPGYEVVLWFGVFTNAKTPKDIVDKLNRETVELFRTQAVREALATDGIEATSGTPEMLATFLKSEIDKWGRMVRDAGARAE